MTHITIPRAVVEQTLEALRELLPPENDTNHGGHDARDVRNWRNTLNILRAALAQPAPEPVAWRYKPMIGSPWSMSDDGYYVSCKRDKGYIVEPLYTAPPQRKPLTLTDLQEALVYTNLIDRDAIDNPEEYDDGSTLAQVDELHRIIKE